MANELGQDENIPCVGALDVLKSYQMINVRDTATAHSQHISLFHSSPTHQQRTTQPHVPTRLYLKNTYPTNAYHKHLNRDNVLTKEAAQPRQIRGEYIRPMRKHTRRLQTFKSPHLRIGSNLYQLSQNSTYKPGVARPLPSSNRTPSAFKARQLARLADSPVRYNSQPLS